MRKLIYTLTVVIASMLAACSGSDNTLYGANGGGGAGGQPDVATLTLLTSSPQIPSDGAANATITALVRDANNNVMEAVPVVFTASSGSLVVTQPAVTDSNGLLTATLSTVGNPANRTITVTGLAGNLQSTVTVSVVGTSLAVNGPSSLALGDTGTFNIVLTNAGGTGISGVAVTITSNNSISQTPVVTDTSGQASFSVTATTGGADTVSAQGLGIVTQHALNVSSDTFAFTAPAPATEIPLNTNQSVTVNWQQNGAAVANQPVSFSSTRGTVSAASALTDGAGNATITVSAANAGPAVITASNAGGTSTQLAVEFVASVADSLDLQADPFTVATNEQSTITAIVRDPSGNLVKNKVVVFQLDDVTGGALSVAQAITDSQGRARTFYTASSTTSANDGVTITAFVQGTPNVLDVVHLTVAQRELFISLGTGNEIFEPNSATYRVEYVVFVTDAQGNGVPNVQVTLSVLSQLYWEGVRTFPPGAQSWTQPSGPGFPACFDEDTNRNGALDGAEDGLVNCNGVLDPGEDVNNNGVLDLGEDFNGSCRIEAGNIATVSVQGVGGGTLTTDQNGFGLVDVQYPQEYAYWLEVTLEARTSVQGTEFGKATTFLLPGSVNDFGSENTSPPGVVSPFGIDQNCATWDYPLP
jgi:Bacterial Ig-like domain (group 1)